MTLYQLLRKIQDDIPVLIFNMKDEQILIAKSKESIPYDLQDNYVFSITIGPSKMSYREYALYVTLEK